MENMFITATRAKLRFPFKGLISVEDLWDLSVESLDSIYKNLNSELKKAQEESLLNKKSAADKELEVKIEIIKYIVSVKQAEKEVALKAREKRQKNQRIMEIIANKEDAELQGKSVDELKKLLDEE